MKRFLSLIFISIIAFGCQKQVERTEYIINGNAEGAYNGLRVYLSKFDERGRLATTDTTMIMGEAFSFNGQVDYPTLYAVTIDGTSGRFDIMIENSDMVIALDSKIITNSKLTGSKSNDVLSEYITQISKQKEEIIAANEALKTARLSNDTDLIAKNEKTFNELNERISNYPLQFIEDNKSSHAIIPIFKAQMGNRNIDTEKFVKTFESIDSTVLNSNDGKILKEQFERVRAVWDAEKSTAIGNMAPNFSAPTPEGTMLSLTDVVSKGKVTIVDFWAAWCGPCRRENPNIVRIYEKYQDKGLEIIGVGLDGSRGQQNPKAAWINAIKDDNLTWHQVSNLKYFDDIAKTYNVRAIPAMFVLNEKGEIIAKNLRGRDLENKIAELLD